MTYKDFCTVEDVAAFRRVEKKQRLLAKEARKVLLEMTPGATIPKGRAKQFLTQAGNVWRVRTNDHSDNSTERAANKALGVKYEVNVLDHDSLVNFFQITRGWSPHGSARLAHSFVSTLKGRML
jgi:hypothetical protein